MTEETKLLESPCLAPKDWNVHQRINWVRSQIGYVQKTKVVTGQGYKAVTHDDVTAMVRPHLIKAGIDTVQTLANSKFEDTGQKTKSGTPIFLYTGVYDISLVNVDNPEDAVISHVEAQALDFGDKAPGKAMSYGKKYVYLKSFDIETGEDEESRIEARFKEPDYITDDQVDGINARLTEHGIEEGFLTWLKATLKIDSVNQLQEKSVEIVNRRIDSAIRAQERKA